MNKIARKIVWGSAGGMILALYAAQSIGYFTQNEVRENVFTVGSLEISLKETDWNPQDGDGENVYPGYTVYKNPTVKNIAQSGGQTQPCYMQVRVIVRDDKGNQITDSKRLNLIRTSIRYDASYDGTWEKQGNGRELIQGRVPGYTLSEMENLPMVNPKFREMETEDTGEWVFCYEGDREGIFEINEEAVLFTDLVIPCEWTKKEIEEMGKFQLDIRAEAVQVTGFENQEQALEFLNSEVEKGGSDET